MPKTQNQKGAGSSAPPHHHRLPLSSTTSGTWQAAPKAEGIETVLPNSTATIKTDPDVGQIEIMSISSP